MPEILVVGWGNPLRGDDGLGCHVARQIRNYFLEDCRVGVVPCHQLGPELTEKIAKAEFVIFVDASAEGLPGTITQADVTPDREFSGDFGVHLTPGLLLAAAKALYNASPEATMFTMTGWCFDFGERMSPAVTNHLDELMNRIRQVIRERENQLAAK